MVTTIAGATVRPKLAPVIVPAQAKQSVKVKALLKTKANAKATAKAKTKALVSETAAVPASRSVILSGTLKKGEWLDVMDEEGTWNVAQIISEPTDHSVEVTYDGWGPEYNQVVSINSGRVAPFHTYTWAVKCWAKYDNWPWWPAVGTFRSPGSLIGQEYLAKETKVFVDFLDNKDITKRCRRWIELSQIKPHQKANFFRKDSNSPDFEASYTRLLLSSARESFDPFVEGCALPIEFNSKLPFSVVELKRLLGLEAWTKLMHSSQVRHGEVFAYQPTSLKENLGFDDEDVDEDAYDDLGELGSSSR